MPHAGSKRDARPHLDGMLGVGNSQAKLSGADYVTCTRASSEIILLHNGRKSSFRACRSRPGPPYTMIDRRKTFYARTVRRAPSDEASSAQ